MRLAYVARWLLLPGATLLVAWLLWRMSAPS
jgi:hypothetical protein